MRINLPNVCPNFPSEKINPCKNFVETAFDFNQMKSNWKFLSVKTCIICRGIFRTHSSSYLGAFFTEKYLQLLAVGSSHQRCSNKKSCSKKCTKSTGKHLCHSFFFNKIASLRPGTLLRKRTWLGCFPLIFLKF